MIKKLVVFCTIAVFVGLYYSISFPAGQPTMSYSTVPDADADYLISQLVSRGEGLYSSFSILYPPGRFFIQGLLFRLIEPSFALTAMSHSTVLYVVFPVVLFILAFVLFEQLLPQLFPEKFHRFLWLLSYGAALGSSFVYLAFLQSAQEAHVVVALLFICLILAKELKSWLVFLTGLLFGLTFLFRVDSGIMLALSLLPLTFLLWKKRVYFVGGVAAVWIPTLIAIAVNGSLFNFFYDTVVLGLFVQPKFMSLPIPENELGLVFLASLLFAISTCLALIVDAQKIPDSLQRKAVQSAAIFMVISYVSALGRSDEPHLWYGLVWIGIPAVYVGLRILSALINREKIPRIFAVLAAMMFIYMYCEAVLLWKSPIFFLLSVTLIGLWYTKVKVSPVTLIVAGLITTLVTFHSVSYLRLRYAFPGIPGVRAISMPTITSEGDEVGGMLMEQPSKIIIDQIRADIPQTEKYLFIFPKNLMLHEFMNLQNPTRYIILANERTNRTENEIITSLESTGTKYFLVFPKSADLREGPVWDWIKTRTEKVKEYQFAEETAELRIKR